MPLFPRRARLRRPGEFRSVLSGGRRMEEPRLAAVVKRAEPGASPRLGLAISSRVARRAADRNRIKRVARESFRQHRLRLPAVDVVIFARGGAAQAKPNDLRASLERLWQRIIQDSASR